LITLTTSNDSTVASTRVTLKIHAAVTESGTTLTRIYGVGPLTAGLILGEVGDVSRFPTRNHLASYTGTAPPLRS
jgi:transposase